MEFEPKRGDSYKKGLPPMFYFRHSGHPTDRRHCSALRKSALRCPSDCVRGPDWSGVTAPTGHPGARAPGHRRSRGNGAQPSTTPESARTYWPSTARSTNHKELEKNLKVDFQFQTHPTGEVLLALAKEKAGVPWTIERHLRLHPATPSGMPT